MGVGGWGLGGGGGEDDRCIFHMDGVGGRTTCDLSDDTFQAHLHASGERTG
jgi:hypothetical protein